MTTSDYQVKVEGPGINVDQKVSPDVAHKIVAFLFGGQEPALSKPGAGGEPRKPKESDEDAEDFLDAHGAKKNPAKIVALGVYMEKHHNKDSFTREELLEAFEEADESPPKNPTRDINTTLKRKWIAEKRGEKGKYYVTKQGQKALNANFKGVRGRSPRRKKNKPKAA